MDILFDIGGTKTRVAATDDGKTFAGEPAIADTPDSLDEGVELVAKLAREAAGGETPQRAAGGVAGPLNREKSVLVGAPNLPEWIGGPLHERLEEALGAPVTLENDSAVVGLGEACFGAGKGSSVVAYITVSTGVGGARIVDGRIDRNVFGFEPGHQIIDIDGSVCPSCNAPSVHGDGPGHLEGYVSGTAVERRFGKPPYEIDDELVWEELARWLSYGLNNTILHWSPEVVVLGGSMIVGDPAIDVHAVRRNLDEVLDIFPEKPEIREATLESHGGLYGAMVLASQMK